MGRIFTCLKHTALPSGSFRIFWCIVVGTLLLVDFLFMGRNSSIYDPFYDNWVLRTAPKY
ncbi:hypothetical protein Esti_004208 [Eimeria stiedai]